MGTDAGTAGFNYLLSARAPIQHLANLGLSQLAEPVVASSTHRPDPSTRSTIPGGAFASMQLMRQSPSRGHDSQQCRVVAARTPLALSAVRQALASPSAPKVANASAFQQPLQLRIAAAVGPAVDRCMRRHNAPAETRILPGAATGQQAVSMALQRVGLDELGGLSKQELQQHLAAFGLPSEDECYVSELLTQFGAAWSAEAVPADQLQRYAERVGGRIAQAFAELDADSSGMLTADKLLAAMHQMGCDAAGSDDAHRMLQLLSPGCSGAVTMPDFARYCCFLPEAQLTGDGAAFCLMDSADLMAGWDVRLHMTPHKQTSQRLLAGGMAGAVSKTMVAPLERLRTIMMASPVALTMREAVQVMWRDGGLGGLFKGNMASVVKVLPASAVQFAVYGSMSDMLHMARKSRAQGGAAGHGGPELLDKLLAGVIAGGASCVATYPLETVRTLMSMPGIAQGNFCQAASEAVRRFGVMGLYAGFSSSLLGDMLGTGLGFAAYETGQQLWQQAHGRKPTAAEKGLVGACSAFVVMTATMPLELIQRRMQVAAASANAAFQYRGPMHALSHISRTEGFGAFYRGSLFAYLKVVPSIACMYMLYELCSHSMGIDGLRRYTRDSPKLARPSMQQTLHSSPAASSSDHTHLQTCDGRSHHSASSCSGDDAARGSTDGLLATSKPCSQGQLACIP